jgi:DNA-binding MarR family transcriptional regulator
MQTESTHKAGIKLIYLLKRFMDEWNEKNLCRMHCPGFNYAQLPLFMTIGKTPISNNEAASKLNISKQASSKIIKELEAINMVQSEKSTADGRSVMLKLTNEGEEYYNYVLTQITELEEKYKKLVGAKNYETALDVMAKLVEFHEKQNC